MWLTLIAIPGAGPGYKYDIKSAYIWFSYTITEKILLRVMMWHLMNIIVLW